MGSVLPVLQIDDYDDAVHYYVSRLSFEILMERRHEPGFPVFMIVRSDDLTLALSEHGRGHSGSEVYIYVDDLSKWHERCVANDVPRTTEPEAKPWGSTELLLTDPPRNALRFCQERTHEGENTPNKPE